MDDEFAKDLEYARQHNSPDWSTAHRCRICGKCDSEPAKKFEQVPAPPEPTASNGDAAPKPDAELEVITPANIRGGEVSKTPVKKDKKVPAEDGEFGHGDRGEFVVLKSEDGLELVDPARNKRGDISR